jgi:hypothetical protein
MTDMPRNARLGRLAACLLPLQEATLPNQSLVGNIVDNIKIVANEIDNTRHQFDSHTKDEASPLLAQACYSAI